MTRHPEHRASESVERPSGYISPLVDALLLTLLQARRVVDSPRGNPPRELRRSITRVMTQDDRPASSRHPVDSPVPRTSSPRTRAHAPPTPNLPDAEEQSVLDTAHLFAEEELKEEVRWATELAPPNGHILTPTDPITLMRRVVESAYRLLEVHYGQAPRSIDTVEFEVTFMTKSCKDDGITIAAWANREGHRPRSLQTRPGNPRQYDSTVTQAVYEDPRHSEQIVEDTHDSRWNAHYRQYEGQRQRIRSAIVWPVLSSNYDMLGTLVMHCDEPGFFVSDHRKFWNEICAVYARRLALARLRLDRSIFHDDTGRAYGPGGRLWPDPPF